ISQLWRRVHAARETRTHADAYMSAQEFLADLELMRASLLAHHGARIAARVLDPLIVQLHTFGFHLHTLDIRQHARVHAEALAALAAANTQQDSEARTGAAEVLDTFRAIAE